MGRHSAPDDDEDDLVGGVDLLFADQVDDEVEDQPAGRHAFHLVLDPPVVAEPTDVAPPETPAPDPPAPARPAGSRPAARPGPGRPVDAEGHAGLLHRGAHASAADLALLRRDGALRARCIAAFLAPFVAYVIVLLVISAAPRTYLVWIWAPAILACVAAGSLLDVAHKRAGTDGVSDR